MVLIPALLSDDPGLKVSALKDGCPETFSSVYPGRGQDGVGNYCATSASFSVYYLRTVLFFESHGPCPSGLWTRP